MVLLAFTAVNAQKSSCTTRLNEPQITFVATSFNFDTLKANANATGKFIYTNTGSAPLIIESAKASCGCTMPTYSTKPLMPGETGEITVRYNTALRGAFRKTLVVISNAANQPRQVLTIKGFVK